MKQVILSEPNSIKAVPYSIAMKVMKLSTYAISLHVLSCHLKFGWNRSHTTIFSSRSDEKKPAVSPSSAKISKNFSITVIITNAQEEFVKTVNHIMETLKDV